MRELVVVVVAVVGLLAFWRYSVGVVGQVAERFGEDRRRWQLMMLPFSVFGPVVAWLLLTRRGGGSGGRYV